VVFVLVLEEDVSCPALTVKDSKESGRSGVDRQTLVDEE
jgi:hypothetical protein